MRYVIVGGGIGGLTAARRLRDLDPPAEITVLQEEPFYYYLRPGLISVLAGERSIDEISPFPPEWFARHGISYRPGTKVVRILPDRREVECGDGARLPYDRLLLATGSEPFVPPVAGIAGKEGVFALRRAADVERILAYLERAKRAVVVGGGLLGLEAARALVRRGLGVTVLEANGWLLPRQLDREGSAVLAQVLGEMGIEVRTGVMAREILGERVVTGVGLEGGEVIAGEMVLFSAGIRPRVELAAGLGLPVSRGVAVDDFMGTGAPGIFACGDVAEWRGRVYGVVPAAREQAGVAAANMYAEGSARYGGTIPAVRLKVVGVELLCVGDTQPRGGPYSEARHADPERGIYRKFVWDGEGKLVGAVILGEKATAVESLVKEGVAALPLLEDLLSGSYPAI
ncbi:NAD(P)/FAD-dependent oxidoreductase [Candidatus Bipolaricaulota sp. J31]